MSFGFGFGFPRNYVAALFTPAQLFTTGVNGAWYDPSDFSTLFQNATGTAPVTAVGQPVGLMLDKSKGLVLGSEVCTDPSFDNPSAWTAGSGITVSGGSAVYASPAHGVNLLNSAAIFAAGKTYKVVVTVSSYTSGRITLRLNSATGVAPADVKIVTGVGVFTCFVTVTTNGTGLLLQADSVTAGVCNMTLTDVSVRELPGNHAYNPSGNSANFPVLSARYNLLTKTEDLGGGWTKQNCTMSTGVADPEGGNTAIGVIPNNASNVFSGFFQAPNFASGSYIQRWLLKRGSKRYFWITTNGGSTKTFCDWDTLSGVSGNTVAFTALSSGWYVVTATGTQATDAGVYPCDANNSTACVGDGSTVAIYCCKPDLRVANDALNQPAYQRVNTATDYDTAGFKPYLSFNGVNQWLQTNSIDFTYGDKMFVSAGVRKLSNQFAVLTEIGSSASTINSSFNIASNYNTTTYDYAFGSRGTAYSEASSTYVAAPVTSIVSGVGNISAPSATLRVNGSQVAQSTATQGTGNYGAYPLYIGARAGTSLFFNGRLYGLVVAGKQASASEIASTEAWLNQKTGAYEGTSGSLSLDLNFTDNTYYSRVI